MMDRRSFLRFTLAMPAIVRASSLMAISPMPSTPLLTLTSQHPGVWPIAKVFEYDRVRRVVRIEYVDGTRSGWIPQPLDHPRSSEMLSLGTEARVSILSDLRV